jgi:hypothetical protein
MHVVAQAGLMNWRAHPWISTLFRISAG